MNATTTTTTHANRTYVLVSEAPLEALVFEVTTASAGQIVEIAVADGVRGGRNMWLRITDRSMPVGAQVLYYRKR